MEDRPGSQQYALADEGIENTEVDLVLVVDKVENYFVDALFFPSDFCKN